MWDFEIVYVSGKKNAVADGLLRMPQPDGWEAPEEPAEDDFFDMELNFTRIAYEDLKIDSSLLTAQPQVLNESYLKES
jgi:hypothetical protein